ncbi:hypothetical protein DFH06DRAFT_730808 [Mycena polygramma]|nr:hypothetical protein DFH06DRAFT_730808 [Mycena polygramma]
MSSTTIDRRSFNHNLAVILFKAVFRSLLFVPSCISYLFFSWEKAAPPSPIFWILTSLWHAHGRWDLRCGECRRPHLPQLPSLRALRHISHRSHQLLPRPAGGRGPTAQRSALIRGVFVAHSDRPSNYPHTVERMPVDGGEAGSLIDSEYTAGIRKAILTCGRSRATGQSTDSMDEEHSDPPHMKPDDAV